MCMKAEDGTSKVTTQGPPGTPYLLALPSWATTWVSTQRPGLGLGLEAGDHRLCHLCAHGFFFSLDDGAILTLCWE